MNFISPTEPATTIFSKTDRGDGRARFEKKECKYGKVLFSNQEPDNQKKGIPSWRKKLVKKGLLLRSTERTRGGSRGREVSEGKGEWQRDIYASAEVVRWIFIGGGGSVGGGGWKEYQDFEYGELSVEISQRRVKSPGRKWKAFNSGTGLITTKR